MKIVDRIERSLTMKKDDVLLRSEYATFGSEAQVARALNTLIEQGKLVRLGRGVYAKAKPSVLSGKAIPIKPLEDLILPACQKLGIPAQVSQLTRDYNAGLTTQIPTGLVLQVPRRRISRKLGFNGKLVKFEIA